MQVSSSARAVGKAKVEMERLEAKRTNGFGVIGVPDLSPLQTELEPTPLVPLAAELRVADVIVRTLAELGVDTFYGVPGGAIASIYDALLDVPSAKIINTRHETGAAFMAMGHSRTGGSLPCILMTSGPGITNALTGLAAAHADGIPLSAIGGEVPRKNYGRGALQEGSRYHLDVLGMARSVTKFAVELTNPRAAVTTIRKAVATALSGKQGPVFISLPLDIANERVKAMCAPTNVSTQFKMDSDSLDHVAAALHGAERGLIMVGSGARHPEAVRWIGTLAASLQMPVVTTPKAKGLFPESDPLSLGVFGYGGHPSASDYLSKGVDVLLCIGCGLGETGTNGWSSALQPTRTFIQIDIDATQIGKNYHVDFALVGAAHAVLRDLTSRVHRKPRRPAGLGIRHFQPEKTSADTSPIHPARLLEVLQKVAPSDTIFTVDMGEHTIFSLHYLRIDTPTSFMACTGLGAMGSGIGAAVGAKVANPKRPVVSICGDYGFQMHGMELATCVQSKIGAVFVIFNDARMRMVENCFSSIFSRTAPMDAPRVDFAAMARAVGAIGLTIKSTADLLQVPSSVFSSDTPVVLDVEVDPTASFPSHDRIKNIKGFYA